MRFFAATIVSLVALLFEIAALSADGATTAGRMALSAIILATWGIFFGLIAFD
jgi:hypothetical protein